MSSPTAILLPLNRLLILALIRRVFCLQIYKVHLSQLFLHMHAQVHINTAMAAGFAPLRPRRVLYLLAIATITLILYHSLKTRQSWRALPLERTGLSDMKSQAESTQDRGGNQAGQTDNGYSMDGPSMQDESEFDTFLPVGGFKPGILKAAGTAYSKMLVVTRTTHEDVSWMTEAFQDSDTVGTTIYVADDPSAPFHPPENKGHEVMVYLTYIIDQYDSLSDVSIFMHAHRYAWHNNDILDFDAIQMITRLSPERVQREGFVNLRCDWNPGCPNWLHPGAVEEDLNKKEEVEFAKAWSELFPGDAVPQLVAATCCAQFAVSRDRIRSTPKHRYVRLREWLLRTPIRDSISGRIWEYLWHFVFTGKHVVCPKEHVCYCDAFGICFGGEEQYKAWWDKMYDKRHFQDKLNDWCSKADEIAKAEEDGKTDEAKKLSVPEAGLDEELEAKIMALDTFLSAEKMKAIQLGDDPKNRAKEAGREWKEGDGF